MPRKFLVVVDDSPEFEGALRYAARRARSTGGRVVMLQVIPPAASDAHWAGVRDEIELLGRFAGLEVVALLGDMATVRGHQLSCPHARLPACVPA